MVMRKDQPNFDAPIPGQSLTAPLGGRPWQSPPQYTTVEEALDYYLPRLANDEVIAQLMDTLEMGVPVTVIANTMQLASVMEGKHTVDVGMLVVPVLIEMILYLAEQNDVEYVMGDDKPQKVRKTLVDKAVLKLEDLKEKGSDEKLESLEAVDEVKEEQKVVGLMGRRQ
jgi:hypothetical protein